MIWGIVEIVAFSAALLLFALMVISNVDLRIKNGKANANLKQEITDRHIVMEEMKKLMAELDGKSSNQNEGFLKFVSESRDWAFQYIERVQITIKNFQDTVHPIAVRHYEDKETTISQEDLDKILKAYYRLVEELPDEGKK